MLRREAMAFLTAVSDAAADTFGGGRFALVNTPFFPQVFVFSMVSALK